MTELLGLFAAILTTASFLPQAMLVVRTGKTDGISVMMYSMFTVGVTAWLVYGLMIGSLPVILANAVTLGLAATILSLKLKAIFAERTRASVALLN
ncbi:MAG: SemiSWEET transporter [Henriciella sp.]|jgi:MtN3 and saliva related transmembrane protein|nr:SemiSWEET transporter [Henriciella sp.]